MNEETEIPVQMLLEEIQAIDPRVIPLAIERLRNRLLQEELAKMRNGQHAE